MSSLTIERGTTTLENMFAMIVFEASALGLSSKKTDSAVLVFPNASFPEIKGISPLAKTSVALYTTIEKEEGTNAIPEPFVVDLWPLHMLTMVPDFKKNVCPASR